MPPISPRFTAHRPTTARPATFRAAVEAMNGRPLQDDIDRQFGAIIKIEMTDSPAVLHGAALLDDGAHTRFDRSCDACVRGDGVVLHEFTGREV